MKLFEYELELSPGHTLELIHSTNPTFSHNIGQIGEIVKNKYPDLKIIDIGANIGDSAIIFSHFCGKDTPILCIEGYDEFFTYLEKNTKPLNVTLSKTYLDADDSERNLRLTFGQGDAGFIDGEDSYNFKSLKTVLNENSLFLDAKLVKTDTEGMDGRILKGAVDWITETKPVLFWEAFQTLDTMCHGPGTEIFTILCSIGYKNALAFDDMGRFLGGFSMDDEETVNKLWEDYPGGPQYQWHRRFLDICAFHDDDIDLYENSLTHFRR
jgi:FkbM family methyltransferase